MGKRRQQEGELPPLRTGGEFRPSIPAAGSGRLRFQGPRRRSPVADGIFYSGSRETLTAQLASWGLIEGAGSPAGQVILVPHGAWELTGSIAGAAFASIQENSRQRSVRGISRVILLGPYHCSGEDGIYLSESVSFETPLGHLPVDLKLNRKLASCSALIKVNDIPHLSEHSLEVLLPLVKYCLREVSIVPILINGENPALISGLAGALRAALESYMEESLVIISSNVSRSSDPAIALSMADEFRFLLENMDAETFRARLAGGRISACGGALVGALFESGLLKGKRFSSLTPLTQGTGEEGEIMYYGAFAAQ